MLFKSRRFKKTDQLALWGVGRGGNLDNSYFLGTLSVGTSAWANLAVHFNRAHLLGCVYTYWTKFKNSLFRSRPKIVGQRGENGPSRILPMGNFNKVLPTKGTPVLPPPALIAPTCWANRVDGCSWLQLSVWMRMWMCNNVVVDV